MHMEGVGAGVQEPAAVLCVKQREHLQQKSKITKAKFSDWKQKIYFFGSYLNLSAVVQHENCSAHLVT